MQKTKIWLSRGAKAPIHIVYWSPSQPLQTNSWRPYEIILHGQPEEGISLLRRHEQPQRCEDGEASCRHVRHVPHERHDAGPAGMKESARTPVIDMGLKHIVQTFSKILGPEVST